MGKILIFMIIVFGACGIGSIILMQISEARIDKMVLSQIRRIQDKNEASRIYNQDPAADEEELGDIKI